MKKSIIIFFVFALLVTSASAEGMMHLLQGGYDAKTLTRDQMDSILNPAVQTRFKLEIENRQQLFRHSFFAD